MFRVAIVTLSDKGAAGQRADESGAVIREIAEQNGYEVVSYTLLPDEREQISAELRRLCDENVAELVLTTGGTGFSPRDCTPEATLDVAERLAPGHRRGDALFELKHNEARDALPRRRGYPGRHADRQPPRQSQGGPGEPGIRDPRTRARPGNSHRPRRGVRKEIDNSFRRTATMKKFFSVLLAALMLFTVAGCGASEPAPAPAEPAQEAAPAEPAEPAPAPESEPAEEPAASRGAGDHPCGGRREPGVFL